MNKFIEIPANKYSLGQRRLVCGVGINDASYKVRVEINGKIVTCSYYQKWCDMLQRCYSVKFQKRRPTYIGCSVAHEWLTFSVFRKWMKEQDWKGKTLDKDLRITGNKIYSPETCIFVTLEINNLLCDHRSARGNMPQGVSLNKKRNTINACCSVDGITVQLGKFDTKEGASKAYKEFKSNHIKSIASKQTNPLRGYLIRIANEISLDHTRPSTVMVESVIVGELKLF